MDSRRRLWAKAITWQVLGLFSMTALGAAFTGSFTAGGYFALAAAAIGLISYVIHERLWARVQWGRANKHISRNES
ncbi:DUF2061 domain-containing protein [Candidatus Halocynthiibacter alkanivorans]|uniref:DUF2061 domain-containing protein n=1 Tax=Candidatus Halocynthiibacter alkanivorans TaxID=2267619 RepID=UPI000DF30780|nr:DUF2061 domain-containing protein [Candidatus Halocynthiibacter alkanivorans]